MCISAERIILHILVTPLGEAGVKAWQASARDRNDGPFSSTYACLGRQTRILRPHSENQCDAFAECLSCLPAERSGALPLDSGLAVYLRVDFLVTEIG